MHRQQYFKSCFVIQASSSLSLLVQCSVFGAFYYLWYDVQILTAVSLCVCVLVCVLVCVFVCVCVHKTNNTG